MERIPDDVLVETMRYVDVPDLLACRLVCKRLADLALHRDVWRHRQVDDADRWVCPALRLAPCLAELCLKLPLAGCGRLSAMTSCAVRGLRLTVDTVMFGALEAAFLIRHQATLGRLRHLEVNLPEEDFFKVPWLLFSTIASVSDLEKLIIRNFPVDLTHQIIYPLHDHLPASSLWNFQCELNADSEPFVNFILAGHAATLEVVWIGGFLPESSRTTALLTAIPHLRVLHCPLLIGMEALALRQALDGVYICVEPDQPIAAQSTAEFLRRAEQLRIVCLQIDEVDVALDLVRALTSSQKAKLRTLVLRFFPWGPLSSMQQLFSMLTALPALQTIKIRDSKSEDDSRCIHTLLHWDAVKRLMSEKPRLQFIIACDIPKYCSEAPCDVCKSGCGGTTLASECTDLLTRIVVDRHNNNDDSDLDYDSDEEEDCEDGDEDMNADDVDE